MVFYCNLPQLQHSVFFMTTFSSQSIFGMTCLWLSIQLVYAQDLQVLNAIQLTATAQKNSFLEEPESAATKFVLDPLKTPQNVQVVNQKMIEDINAQRISDVVGLVSGVSLLNPTGGIWDNYSFRGFNTDQTIGVASLRNGLTSYLGLNVAHDLVNVERIEFLKGPEAALYGAGEPGGVLNIVTKKPEFEPHHSIELRGGSYNQYRSAIDSTNAITETIAYRLGVAYENNKSFRDEVQNNKLFVAPQLTWKPSDTTQVDYDSEYTVLNTLFDRGVLAVNQQLGVIPNSRFLGEKDDGLMTVNDYLQQVRIQHQWNPMWSTQTTFNYKDNTWRGFSSEAYQLLNAQGDLNRERRYRIYDTTSYLFSHDLTGQFNTGSLNHRLFMGMTYSDLKVQNHLLRYRKKGSTSSEINIYDPIYGVNLPAVTSVYNTLEHQKNAALSLSDYIEINPKWAVLLGGRYDYYQQDYREFIAGIQGSQYFMHFSPKVAVNYLLDDHASLFASVGQSFHLNSGLDIQQQPFKPEKAWTYELGTKAKWLDDRIMASVSLFHVKKQNVLTTNPLNSAYMMPVGQETSRGIEFDLTAQPVDPLNLKFAYAYTDAIVSKSEESSGIAKGSALLNSPKHHLNLLVMYDVWQAGASKIGLGGNIQYVSARTGNVYDNGFNLPSYTLLNLNSYYQMNPKLKLQLNLNNLFNTIYYTASVKDEWVTPGHPREIFLSMNYQFN